MAALVATVGHGSTALWYLTRATGLVSLIVLSATVVLGTVASVGWTTDRWPRFLSQSVHRNLSLFCLALIGIHIVSTVGDGYVPIGLTDAVIPFRSPYRPIWVGLGALALDMLLAVAITSALRRRIGVAAWRGVHWLAYACWPIAAVHGLGSGSDARLPGAMLVFVVCTGSVAAAVAWRLAVGRARSVSWRLGGAVAGAAVLLVITAFAAAGPLRPGWSHRAGHVLRTPGPAVGLGRHLVLRSHDADEPVALLGCVSDLGYPGRSVPDLRVGDGRHVATECQRRVPGHPHHAAGGHVCTTPGPDHRPGRERRRRHASQCGVLRSADRTGHGPRRGEHRSRGQRDHGISQPDPEPLSRSERGHGHRAGLRERSAMSLTLRNEVKAAPTGGRRLLHGLSGGAADPGLQTHLDRWGELRLRGSRLIDELDGAGLVGHGGAWFPVSTKWRSVASASRRRPVVVANGAESEPASRKDALLLSHAPHLVLDGLALAADALGAHQAIVYVPAASIPVVEAAIEERRARRLDPIAIEIAESPDAFLAGQESAVVNALSGRRVAVPSFVALTPIRERGVGGRPTLVQNVETLAHVALIARFGATWFRQVGTPENPGTMLLTVNASRRSGDRRGGARLLAAPGRRHLRRGAGPRPRRPPRRLRRRVGVAKGVR